ncbi:MAG: hypothetical protein DK306_001669 [Chloroflexi bacterium]|nr:MAG: hypothetical protein DK306_001669 [Chloroflexota bacterium]
MESLLAGLIAGAAMGLISMAVIASIMVESQALAANLRDRYEDQPLPFLAIAATLGAQAAWAAIGLGMGSIYWAIRDNAQNGAASPAWGYSLTIALLAGFIVLFAFAARLPAGRRLAFLALLFVAIFGWLLPNLAEA